MSEKNIFANLNLQDALDLAILIEEEAKERYIEFARQVGSLHADDAGSFFSIMAKNEAKHGKELSEKRKKLFGTNPSTITRLMVDVLYGVEAPDFDLARSFMSAKHALEVALSCEVKAYNFFDKIIKQLNNEEVIALFKELKDEEIHHQQLVKDMIAKTSGDFDPDVDSDDIDEPSGL